MSCYQTLDGMWDLQMTEAENLRDFARRLDEKAVESRNIIEAKYELFSKFLKEHRLKFFIGLGLLLLIFYYLIL